MKLALPLEEARKMMEMAVRTNSAAELALKKPALFETLRVICLCPLVRLRANCEILFYYFNKIKKTLLQKNKNL